MHSNIQTRAQEQNSKRFVVPSKPMNGKTYKADDWQESKQDNCHQGNIPTEQKPRHFKEDNQSTRFTSVRINSKREDKFISQRAHIINTYSKMQFCFNLSMESLFLAIDIFDRYTNCCAHQLKTAEVSEIALTCFNIAVKYEEIYPPNLEQLQAKMKITIQFKHYVTLELRILKVLDYCLNFTSPIEYFQDFNMEMTDEKKSYIYLYLELASLNYELRRTCSWGQIIEAIKILFLPINHVICNQQKQGESKTGNIFKVLVTERSRLGDDHFWLNKKYNTSKFHSIIMKPVLYIQQEEDQE